jgi:hypothetical protein
LLTCSAWAGSTADAARLPLAALAVGGFQDPGAGVPGAPLAEADAWSEGGGPLRGALALERQPVGAIFNLGGAEAARHGRVRELS